MQHEKYLAWKFMLEGVTVGTSRRPRNSSEVETKKYFCACIITKQQLESDLTVI